MGTITIQEQTTKDPITLMGMESGICYNSNTSDPEKNYKRGLECVRTNHGRVLEYPQVYIVIDGYSAKVIRELTLISAVHPHLFRHRPVTSITSMGMTSSPPQK